MMVKLFLSTMCTNLWFTFRLFQQEFSTHYSGAVRGMVFGGAITSTLSAPGVAPTLSSPTPAVLGGSLNLTSYWNFFLSIPGKFLSAQVKLDISLDA